MKKETLAQKTHRRGFLGILTASAAALGLSAIIAPLKTKASPNLFSENLSEADEWFNKVKGKHRMVFDANKPHGDMPFSSARVFLSTNEKTGTDAKECGVVVVLRSAAIGYAFEDKLWNEYKFGEVFSVEDAKTKLPALRNPYSKPEKGDFPNDEGKSEMLIGINELQESGVLFCVCDMAIAGWSGKVAKTVNKEAKEVKKEWLNGLLPHVQVVPSGIWAIGRAQEHGCAYFFIG